MKLLAWNIRAGGGSRLAGIAAAIAGHAADVLVLSEYHGGAAGARLRATLHGLGYRHMTAAEPDAGRKGVLIAARNRLRDHGPVTEALPEPWKLVTAEIGGVHVVGVYMPNLLAKVPYWEALLAHLAPRGATPALAAGDFNTCRHFLDETGATDRCAHFMDRVETIGFHDAWRRRHGTRIEPTWFSHRRNGFRLDHAFVSSGVPVRAVEYSQAERISGLSDHAAMRLSLGRRLVSGGEASAPV